jgi:hypothetical protein
VTAERKPKKSPEIETKSLPAAYLQTKPPTQPTKPTDQTCRPSDQLAKPIDYSSTVFDEPIEKDDELDEFEVIEKYVEDHPSFRSSTSFVENLFPKKQQSQQTTQAVYCFDNLEEHDDDTVCGDNIDEDDRNTFDEFNSSSPIHEEEALSTRLSSKSTGVQRAHRKIKRLPSDDDDDDDDDQVNMMTKQFSNDLFVQSNHKAYNSNTYKSLSQIELESNGFDDDKTWLEDDANTNGHKILSGVS